MGEWRLVDGRAPAESPEAFPSIVIESESQLREALMRLQKLEPAVVSVQSPRNKAIQLGIGGPWAGIRYFPSPQKSPAHRVVLADRPGCAKRVDFAAEEDTIAFFSDSLIPVDEAIEIAVYFFTHRELPNWVSWKEWDPAVSQWRMHRGRPVASGNRGKRKSRSA